MSLPIAYVVVSHGPVSDIVVVDFSTSSDPVIVTNLLIDWGVGDDIDFWDDHLYLIVDDPVEGRAVGVINVASPEGPFWVGHFGGPEVGGLVVINHFAHVAGLDHSFSIWDVTTPAAPQMQGLIDLPGLPLPRFCWSLSGFLCPVAAILRVWRAGPPRRLRRKPSW